MNSTEQHRADVYRLLSACFYEPEDCFAEEDVFGQLASSLSALGNPLAQQAERMGTEFRATRPEQLIVEYSHLFMGPFDIPAKPYGSVYLDGEKVVMGDSTINAREFYAKAEFEIADGFCELPDHITVELEFLYLLSFKQLEALSVQNDEDYQSYRSLELEFLEVHLGRWVSDFCRNIRDNTEVEYYRCLADITEAFVLAQRA